jgi:hypothetical protein
MVLGQADHPARRGLHRLFDKTHYVTYTLRYSYKDGHAYEN